LGFILYFSALVSRAKIGGNALIFEAYPKPKNGALPAQTCALKKQSGALSSNEGCLG